MPPPKTNLVEPVNQSKPRQKPVKETKPYKELRKAWETSKKSAKKYKEAAKPHMGKIASAFGGGLINIIVSEFVMDWIAVNYPKYMDTMKYVVPGVLAAGGLALMLYTKDELAQWLGIGIALGSIYQITSEVVDTVKKKISNGTEGGIKLLGAQGGIKLTRGAAGAGQKVKYHGFDDDGIYETREKIVAEIP